ncbi:unnamed protein product [Symbiodinium natans]|uniref:EF-hand domain-containing protein n=1 Tax=Symbiodinium natans TaxID=878477 RepID=A0A812PRM0_9DINO|nr:unnamed protein product [Symbiodinium natans]
MKRAADGFPPGMPPGKMAVPPGVDPLQTLWKAAAALASLPGMPAMPAMPGMPGMAPPFKPAPAAPTGTGDAPKVAPGSVVPPKAPKAMGGLLLPDVSGNGAMPAELPTSVPPPWKISSPPPKPAPGQLAKPPGPQAETSPEVAPCKSQMAPNDLMPKQQTMPGFQAPPWKAPAAAAASSPPSGTAGFSKAAAAASAMGQASPTELLRRGEELLRQTAQLHQQNEIAQKQQEEERRRQEEKEQARQRFEEQRRQQEEERKRLREESDRVAQGLQDELRKLIEVAELEVQMAEAEAQKIDEPKQCEEILRVAEDFEVVSLSAATAVKACFEFMDGKHMKLKGNTEATMSNCASLLKRSHAAKAGSERASSKVRVKAKPAREEVTAKSLQAELDTLLAAAEIEVEQVKSKQAEVLKAQAAAEAEAKATPEGGGGALDQELVRVATEFEASSEAASKSVTGCVDRMDPANLMRIRGPTEELKASAALLQNRARAAKSILEETLQKVRSAKAAAAQRVEREVRKVEAQKEAARQEAIFKQYDKDGDGKLNEAEIRAYVAGEYSFELGEDRLEQILAASSNGVRHKDFAKLRSQIGDAWKEILNKQRKEKNDKQMATIKKNSAEILSALSGVEGEVAKAEAQVRILGPMIPRGAAMLDMLSERTEAAESAVDAARDFLAAAKEQALALGVDSNFETEAKQMAAVEAKNLQMKVTALENRVNAAAHVSKAARSKIQLQERKAALLREATSM